MEVILVDSKSNKEIKTINLTSEEISCLSVCNYLKYCEYVYTIVEAGLIKGEYSPIRSSKSVLVLSVKI